MERVEIKIMGYTFDYFVATLKCSICGVVSPENIETNIQTKLCRDRKMAPYKVGNRLDLVDDPGGWYLCLLKPEQPATFKLVDYWECPTCSAPYNWVLVTIKQSVIESIENILLDDGYLASINYITEDCILWDFYFENGRLVRMSQ